MNYFFPSPIPSLSIKQLVLPDLKCTVNSGTNALRLLLRSYKLPNITKVAIPAYVCNAVKEAVEKESLDPLLMDLKSGHTFWTDYNLEKIKNENCQVIILVHLYGFIHPETEKIVIFCKENNIKLIHDAAQSFGINEDLLKGDGIIYSFGPGKSTTAAGGAIIKRYDINSSCFNLRQSNLFSFQKIRSKLFLKSRIFGYKISKPETILNSIIHKLPLNKDLIFSMDNFQLKMASYVISNFETIKGHRKKRYGILLDKIKTNSSIEVIPVNHENGLYFKMILFIKDEMERFKSFLSVNDIPYFCLADFIDKNIFLLNFNLTAYNIIELSCESSIPETEIIRVANLLHSYK